MAQDLLFRTFLVLLILSTFGKPGEGDTFLFKHIGGDTKIIEDEGIL